MATKIQLTPAELLAQSQEMLSLQKDFEDLFKQTESVLGQVNANWSANLANNFAGKISSAQKAFSQIASMLGQGGNLAATSANTYETIDSLLAKGFAGDVVSGVSNIIGNVGDAVSDTVQDVVEGAGKLGDIIGTVITDEIDYIKECWEHTGNFLEWANGEYQNIPEQARKYIEKALGGQLTTSISMTYDIITGNVGWDTAKDFILEVVEDSSTAQAIIGAFEYTFSKETLMKYSKYEDTSLEYVRDGNVLSGINTLCGEFSDLILVGALDQVVDIGLGVLEDLPMVGLLEEVVGIDLSETWDGWMDAAHDGIEKWTEYSSEAIAEFEENFREGVADVWDGAVDIASDIKEGVEDVWDGAKEKASDFVDGIKDAGDAVGDFISGLKFW